MIGEIPIVDPIRRNAAEDPVSRMVTMIKKHHDINMMELKINM